MGWPVSMRMERSASATSSFDLPVGPFRSVARAEWHAVRLDLELDAVVAGARHTFGAKHFVNLIEYTQYRPEMEMRTVPTYQICDCVYRN